MKKTRVSTEYHNWTKSELKKIYKVWDTISIKDLADELNVTESKLKSIVSIMRQEGFVLAKKRTKGIDRQMIRELKAEIDAE